MKHEVTMPRLSDKVEEGVLVAWFAEKGSAVTVGDLLAEVQVEKTSSEIHAPTSGILVEARVLPGGVISQGAILAIIDDVASAKEITETYSMQRDPVQKAKASELVQVLASPAAKRLARELQIDLAALKGTGPGGRIIEADVQAAAKSKDPTSRNA